MTSAICRISVLLFLALPSAVLAYGEGGEYLPSRPGPGASTSNTGQVTAAKTNAVVNLLTRGVRGQRLGKVYRYDCYRSVYGAAAAELNGIAGYAKARTVLTEVERSLGRTVNRNLDRRAPRVQSGGQQFRAIRADRLPVAKEAFIAALEAGQTKLLRSSTKAEQQNIRIAGALNSNKQLPRSALLLLTRIR